jgi:aspartate/methionine/tyrosine aminotransferase
MEMFESLEPQAPDALLGITTAFMADQNPHKIDLGVGVYRDATGATPVMAAVRQAEQLMLSEQASKSYIGMAGNRAFATFIENMVLGAASSAALAGRVTTLQTPGGCGALRLASELVLRAAKETPVVVSEPTWPNHVPLIGGTGLAISSYPYYSAATGGVDFAALCAALDALPAGTLVVLHACCHNPTGADLSPTQWQTLVTVFARRSLVPLFDLAYQGLGLGPDEDVYAIRLFAAQLPEMLVAVSCSKSFGLYRERVGAVLALAPSQREAGIVMGHLQMIARRMYSMSPDHGAAIVATIANNPALVQLWSEELKLMRERIRALRVGLADALRSVLGEPHFDFIKGQQGMFSLLGLSATAVQRLATQHHIYVAPDSRMNVAGLSEAKFEQVAAAIGAVRAE